MLTNHKHHNKKWAQDTFIDGTIAIASSTVSGQRLPRTQSCTTEKNPALSRLLWKK